jgi:hypothetical protein
MKKFWDQLKPQERRWLIFIGVIVFATMNYLFIWPQFKEWSANRARMDAAQGNIAKYTAEIAHKPDYEHKIHTISPDEQNIAPEDQAVHFEEGFREKAVENGVQIQSTSRPSTRMDDFTMEQRETLQVLTGERNLVDYLYSLGSSGSSVRVESMSLRPVDLNRYQLHADLTLVESYFRNPTSSAARTTAGGATRTASPAPAAAPANIPATPTNRLGLLKHQTP